MFDVRVLVEMLRGVPILLDGLADLVIGVIDNLVQHLLLEKQGPEIPCGHSCLGLLRDRLSFKFKLKYRNTSGTSVLDLYLCHTNQLKPKLLIQIRTQGFNQIRTQGFNQIRLHADPGLLITFEVRIY